MLAEQHAFLCYSAPIQRVQKCQVSGTPNPPTGRAKPFIIPILGLIAGAGGPMCRSYGYACVLCLFMLGCAWEARSRIPWSQFGKCSAGGHSARLQTVPIKAIAIWRDTVSVKYNSCDSKSFWSHP